MTFKINPPAIEKYIHKEVILSRRQWEEIWYAMAEQDTTRYLAIKGLNVLEFWSLFDAWQNNIKSKNEQIRTLKNKR